jgi:hypothetical protein
MNEHDTERQIKNLAKNQAEKNSWSEWLIVTGGSLKQKQNLLFTHTLAEWNFEFATILYKATKLLK